MGKRLMTQLREDDADIVRRISTTEHRSESEVVATLVHAALELAEDISLARVGEERLRTLDPTKTLSIEEALEWSQSLKEKKKARSK